MHLWLVLSGCSVPLAPCASDADCSSAFGIGWTCTVEGSCLLQQQTMLTGTDTGPTDTLPTGDTGTSKPPQLVVVINEVLYDPTNEEPATGEPPPGDANGDGVYVHDDDEFVELVNISGGTVDLTGYTLYDQEAWDLEDPRHVVPAGTILPPGHALVVFGGGSPDQSKGAFGGATVQVATGGRINLNNSNDVLRVAHPSGVVVATFDVTARSNNPNESYTRNPDVTGPFEQHSNQTTLLFSPGTRVDGTPFP
ncbi:MAG: lamin tail domain-containing protein [Myxococcales bacterium]|nr:lamin tail domain-containing protein [Myxococcales bacterium]